MNRVAYKPLSTSPSLQEDCCEIDNVNDSCGNSNHHYKYDYDSFSISIKDYWDSRQIRILFYLIATILLLISAIQLLDRAPKHLSIIRSIPQSSQSDILRHQDVGSELPPSSKSISTEAFMSNSLESFDPQHQEKEVWQYDDYLSSILQQHNYHDQGAKKYIDDLDISHDFDPAIYVNSSKNNQSTSSLARWWQLNSRNDYITVTNYIRAMKTYNYNSSLTLTTQATTDFMYHALELCKRWAGPISVAVFSPGTEMQVVTTLIKFMRQCLPGPLSACIRDKISWHLVYNKAHAPFALNYPTNHLDSQHFKLFVNLDQCPKLAGPEPSDMIRQFEEQLRRANGIWDKSYRQQFKLPYPINILRNTARLAANTKYVLASDIELYPSLNLVPMFVNFIKKHDIKKQYSIDKFVFTLPIFEVQSNISAVPKTKSELVKMVSTGDAIFFHKYVCDACQNFPNRSEWLLTNKQGWSSSSYYDESLDKLVVFGLTQRDKTRSSWEPIFIGTNDDPLYDDRLTWEGRRDKMIQMYEMCLRNYYLLVLDNAFLVHAPGIKHFDHEDTMKRLDYIKANNMIYYATLAQLKQQFATSGNIDKC